jgi:mutator protein MutT
MKTVDTVSLIIIRDGKVLVEKRNNDKETDPGVIVVPGGHVEDGESLEEACRRELREELGLDYKEFKFIQKMLWRTPIEDQLVHYFVCEDWNGVPQCNEADSILFLTPNQLDVIDIEEERRIIENFFQDRKN